MLNITSRDPKVKRIDLRKAIQLLGEEYVDLPYEIYVYKDKDSVQNERLQNPNMSEEAYDYVLDDGPAGVCIHETKTIKLFPFNQELPKPYPHFLLDTIAFMYHEIRHAWQYENGLFLDEVDVTPTGDDFITYLKRPSEIDAYKFAEEQLNQHKVDIYPIIGIDPKRQSYHYTFDLNKQINLAISKRKKSRERIIASQQKIRLFQRKLMLLPL